MSNLEKGETPMRDSDTATVVENAPFKKAPSPEIEEVVHDADDGDAPDPTIQQIFDQGKSGLLDDIRLLLRSVSEMELADDFDETLSFCELPSIARRILKRLKRIEHLNIIVNWESFFLIKVVTAARSR